MTREGVEFRVLDAKSGADITHQILTQIIMEEEASGEQMLPVNFLRQLIGMYGNSMQGLIPHYLEASMEQFHANQLKLRKAFEESMEANPLARLAQQNIAMFQAAAAAFMPGAENGSAEAPAAPKAARVRSTICAASWPISRRSSTSWCRKAGSSRGGLASRQPSG
jgi:polyhydroxyalkanoate synthesis repressor PhaR